MLGRTCGSTPPSATSPQISAPQAVGLSVDGKFARRVGAGCVLGRVVFRPGAAQVNSRLASLCGQSPPDVRQRTQQRPARRLDHGLHPGVDEGVCYSRDDVQRHGGVDIGMQPHRDRVGAEVLMCRLGQLTVRLSRLGPPAFLIAADDVGGRDRTEQLAGVGGGPSPAASTAPRPSSGGLQLVGVLEAADGLDLAGPADRRRPGARRPGWRTIASPRGSR